MSALLDALIVPGAVVDPSLAPIDQLRAAAQRDLRAWLIDRMPASLWPELCVAGACAADELASLFERENHREALKELVALLDRDTLVAIAARSEPPSDDQPDRGVLFQSVLRLAQLGAIDDAIAITQRFERLASDSHLLLALCEIVGRARSAPLVERAIALSSVHSHARLTADLCAMVAFVDEPTTRASLLALCERRVAHTKPEHLDIGDNPWGWLALAYARLDRVDDVLRCLDRASESVRAGQCDPLSDARFDVECALVLDPVERHEARAALAHRAFAAMKSYRDCVWEWLVETVAALVPSLEQEARAWLPTDSQPPPAEDEPAELDPVSEALQHATELRARWLRTTTEELRGAIAEPSAVDEQPDERAPPSTEDVERDRRAARTQYERWMRSEFDPRARGWVSTLDGEAITFEAQSRVLGWLEHDELEALLDHACADHAQRAELLYLVAEAARGRARKGELAAMRAHVESIARWSTTPALEFELVTLMPDALRGEALRRLFASTTVEADVALAQQHRLSSLMTAAAFASDGLRAIVLDVIETIPSPAVAMECLGRLLRCGAHPRADDARCAAHANAIAPLLLRDPPSSLAPNADMQRALCALDDSLARSFWAHLANRAPPRVSWPLAARVFGPALIEEFAIEIAGDGTPIDAV